MRTFLNKNRNKIIINLLVITTIIITIFISRDQTYSKLIDGEVTVGVTVRYDHIGTSTHLRYLYIVDNVKYLGYTQPNSFKKNDIIVPKGKYFVVFNKRNPKINAIIFDKEASNYSLKKVYKDIKIDKTVLKSSVRYGVNKAKIIN